MAFEYNIENNFNDTKPRTCMITCHTLATVVSLLSSTFLVANIYSNTGSVYDYIFNVGVYNIFTYLSMLFVYLPISYLVDRTNRVWFYRLGLLLRASLVILFACFGGQMAGLTILAGCMHGSSDAVYYASYNVLKEEMVSRKKMGNYASLTYMIGKVVEIVCPITIGAIIEASSFSTVALIVLGICAIQIVISFGIKAERPKNSSFSLKKFFATIKENPSAKNKLKLIYLFSFVFSTSTLIGMLVNICTMIEYGSSFSLGAMTSAISIAAIFSMFLFDRLSKPGKRGGFFVACAVLLIASSIFMLIDFSRLSIIIFNFLTASTGIIYKVSFDRYRNGILKEEGLYSEISEHQTIVESVLNIARITVFGLMMLVSLFKSMIAFEIFIIFAILGISTLFILLLIYEKKYISKSQL